MKILLASAIIGIALIVSAPSNAQAPAGSTGECKDGSFTTAESKKGACAGHGGVKDWYASTAPAKAPAAPAAAKAPAAPKPTAATAPAGSTGACKDGTFTTAESKKGACAGHGGVKEWYASAAPAKAAAAPAAPTATKPAATTTAPAAPAASTRAAPTANAAPTAAAPAPGGGPGQVWVNTNSKVYHCPGDRYYGKTKQGEYMTESAAKAAGNRADHGKACS